CSCRVRSASINPLIPSPGSPNTTRTPQSMRRSTNTSAAVTAMSIPPAGHAERLQLPAENQELIGAGCRTQSQPPAMQNRAQVFEPRVSDDVSLFAWLSATFGQGEYR